MSEEQPLYDRPKASAYQRYSTDEHNNVRFFTRSFPLEIQSRQNCDNYIYDGIVKSILIEYTAYHIRQHRRRYAGEHPSESSSNNSTDRIQIKRQPQFLYTKSNTDINSDADNNRQHHIRIAIIFNLEVFFHDQIPRCSSSSDYTLLLYHDYHMYIHISNKIICLLGTGVIRHMHVPFGDRRYSAHDTYRISL